MNYLYAVQIKDEDWRTISGWVEEKEARSRLDATPGQANSRVRLVRIPVGDLEVVE